jgi:ribosomal protein L37AE/L43A
MTPFGMDIGILSSPSKKGCKQCHDETGETVLMEATQVWDPSQCTYVDAWECPECGRQLYRDEGAGVGKTTPDGERF